MSSKLSQKRNCDSSLNSPAKRPSQPSPSKKPKLLSSRTEPTHDPLWQKITSLPANTITFLLYDACKHSPGIPLKISEAIEKLAAEKIAEERTRPIADFDHLSKECWHLLTNGYKRKSGSKMGIGKVKVVQEVDAMRIQILQAAGRNARFETRRNAVETLRKVCKSLVLCREGVYVGERVGGGLMGLLEGFVGSLVGVVGEMSEGERERFREEGWGDKLVELRRELEGEGKIVGELEVVYALFEKEEIRDREAIEREKRMNAAEERQGKEDHERRGDDNNLQKEKAVGAEKDQGMRMKNDVRRKETEHTMAEKMVKSEKKRPISLDSDDDIQIVDSW